VHETLRINGRITIPRSELRFSFVRSSGPGGQNVNKVASKAMLRWNIVDSGALPDDVKARFVARYARKINDRGELVLTSQRYRDQARNVSDCLEKLGVMLRSVAKAPRARKRTKPTKASREARLSEKRAVAEKKRRRAEPREQ
jgi:ribosome-associated protein